MITHLPGGDMNWSDICRPIIVASFIPGGRKYFSCRSVFLVPRSPSVLTRYGGAEYQFKELLRPFIASASTICVILESRKRTPISR
jgi:hypothetical protein